VGVGLACSCPLWASAKGMASHKPEIRISTAGTRKQAFTLEIREKRNDCIKRI
jgi:hypothetical protein